MLRYLAILPFITGLGLPPFINFFPPDPREVPVYIGFAFVICYFLWVYSTGEIKKVPTIIPACFIGYNLLSMHLAPQVSVIFNQIGYPGIWLYKAFLFSLVYFLFFIAVFSESLSWDGFCPQLFKVLQWSGLITAVYMLLQFLHLDQFAQLSIGSMDLTNSPEMGGFMYTPTLSAAFLAICVPTYLKSKNWWMAIPVIIAIVLTKSLFAMAAVVISVGFWLCAKHLKLFGFMLLNIVILLVMCHHKFENSSHGRFTTWHQIIQEWKLPPIYQEIKPDMDAGTKEFLSNQNHHIYPLTGMGPGSYVPLFSIKENTPWKEGHNEFLEYFLYERGVGGAVFFALAMIWIYSISPATPELIILMSIFSAIMVLSMGTFIWHLEPFRSLTCVVLALICALRKDVKNDERSHVEGEGLHSPDYDSGDSLDDLGIFI